MPFTSRGEKRRNCFYGDPSVFLFSFFLFREIGVSCCECETSFLLLISRDSSWHTLLFSSSPFSSPSLSSFPRNRSARMERLTRATCNKSNIFFLKPPGFAKESKLLDGEKPSSAFEIPNRGWEKKENNNPKSIKDRDRPLSIGTSHQHRTLYAEKKGGDPFSASHHVRTIKRREKKGKRRKTLPFAPRHANAGVWNSPHDP